MSQSTTIRKSAGAALCAALVLGALGAAAPGAEAQAPPTAETRTPSPAEPPSPPLAERLGPAGQGLEPPAGAWTPNPLADTVPGEPGPAADLYREARSALNRGAYDEAVRGFRELRRQHDADWVRPRSLYFEALALVRAGAEGADALGGEEPGDDPSERARELLEIHLSDHPDAPTAGDARRLLARAGSQERLIRLAGDTVRLPGTEWDGSAFEELFPDGWSPPEGGWPEGGRLEVFPGGGMALRGDRDLPEGCSEEELEVREAALGALAGGRVTFGPGVPGTLPDEISERVRSDLERIEVIRRGEDERPRVRLFPSAGRPVELEAEDRELLWEIVYDTEDPCAEALRFPALRILARDAEGVDVERFREVVENPDLPESARRTALSLLAGEDLPLDVLEDLLESLQGEPEMVRRLLFVLSRSEEPGAVDLLIEVARTTEDRELRLEAIRQLEQREEPAAREFLRETLRGPS